MAPEPMKAIFLSNIYAPNSLIINPLL